MRFSSRPRILFALALLPFTVSTAMMHAAEAEAPAAFQVEKADAEIEKNAEAWAGTLGLHDLQKTERIKSAITLHLKAVRDWHNSHPFSIVPAGINPATGQALSNQDRQLIADSAMPRSVHEELMSTLRKELTPPQVEAVLDKYTVGKVAFTLKGYKAIVPDLTPAEEEVIVAYLEQAREQAIDFKGMKLISAVFEIYKTKCEQHLNANGRNWRQLYKAYVDSVKAQKAAKPETK